MKIRKGIFAVVYKKVDDYYHFAVFERQLHWKGWEMIKGGLEKNETYEGCVRRELKEEAGIRNIIKLEKLNEIQSWNYTMNGERIKTEFVPFLVEVPSDTKLNIKNNPTPEHTKAFFLNFRANKIPAARPITAPLR